MFTREEFEKMDKERKVRAIKLRERELQAAKRDALLVSQVTGDPHWDHFLSIVQERIVRLRKEMDTALDLLQSSDDFTTEGLINQKLAVRLLGREIEALNWAIELPQAILEKGDRAKELLGNIEQSTH